MFNAEKSANMKAKTEKFTYYPDNCTFLYACMQM